MTTLTSGDAARPDPLALLRRPAGRFVLALPLLALGDWLLRGPSGSALLLLAFGVATATALANPWLATPRTLLIAAAALVLGCLPMIEDVGPLPLAFALAGLATFALLLTGQGTPGWLRRPLDILRLYLSGPRRVIGDGLAASRAVTDGQWGRHFSIPSLLGWIVPIGLLGVFAILFADANPLLARWLASVDLAFVLKGIQPDRLLLWAVLFVAVWPFLHMRLAPAVWWLTTQSFLRPPNAQSLTQNPQPPHPEVLGEAEPRRTQEGRASFEAGLRPAPQDEECRDSYSRQVSQDDDRGSPRTGHQAVPAVAQTPPVPLGELLLGRAAIARSLVLFNLLFAVQTVMDAVYLWGGVALPEGLTYATYAHRGAYPLIVTALLAAAFVLAAMRRGGPAEGSPLLRALVFLFVAQNVGLVLSSILRLDLYVSVYSLTYWRVAAFVWMGLVAIGLVLIGLRIALGQTNRWLVGANLIAATATLYACCFVNFAALIAEFNVSHQAETQKLDLHYLATLGPQAIPALDHAIPATSASASTYCFYRQFTSSSRRDCLTAIRDRLAQQQREETLDWRAWTYRARRLSDYLAAHPTAPQPTVSVPLPPDAARPGEPAPVEPTPSPR